jgi:aldose sugar dehydrogenase
MRYVPVSRFVFLFISLAALAHAQTRDVRTLYTNYCASCHGRNLEGGSGSSLIGGALKYGSDDASLSTSIRLGYPQAGMPPWSGVLTEGEIQTLVVYIREKAAAFARKDLTFPKPVGDLSITSERHTYRLETVADGLREPWSLAFLPGNRAVVTEKTGHLRLIENGQLNSIPITGIPTVDTGGQAGLFDVVAHPDYAENGWLYLAFADPQTDAAGNLVAMTKIIRGRLQSGAFTDQTTIYAAPLASYRPAGGVHFGGRIAFDTQGFIYFSIGERGAKENAQDLTLPNGKIHRLHDDGRIPADNPFVATPGALGSIWSYGHRNPQGLCWNIATAQLWSTEHGARGGDELNLILKGRNYGWPLTTYGMDYSTQPLTYQLPGAPTRVAAVPTREGIEPPVTYWTPSIAACGTNFYTGTLFPNWQGNLFIASLAAQELHRLELREGRVVHDEILFKNIGRIRHVITGPEGALYVLLPDRVVRLVPTP